ncbi:MAG: mechanosensitive ion channel family protein [Alphaproteobacteria bacterium]|nr:mechanosensitive ion channel family protein [Alphaproteobacteria bacterium]
MRHFIKRLSCLLLVLISLSLPAIAQDATKTGFDYAQWQTTATRAEGIIKDAVASTPALGTLRATLAQFRSQALDQKDVNQARIKTLESQITALGAAPADGTSEAPELAIRRTTLNSQLADARAPGLAAQEAYQRADGLIGELDQIIRVRQTNLLYARDGSPLNPSYWSPALTAVTDFTDGVKNEISDAMSSEAQLVQTRQQLPLLLGLLIIGLVLLTRARRWLLAGFGLVTRRSGPKVKEARSLLFSTTQVIVPLVGIWLIVRAAELTGLLGLRGEMLLSTLPLIGAYVFGALWLSHVLFVDDETPPSFLDLSEMAQKSGARLTAFMGGVLAVGFALNHIVVEAGLTAQTRAVLLFPVIVAGGYLLVRMGLLLHEKTGRSTEADDENSLQDRIYGLIRRVIITLGVIGPVLAAIGYFDAASLLIFPTIKTLALFGTANVAFRFLLDIADSLTRSATEDTAEQDASEKPATLVPVALGLTLILVSIPILALIWGARVSDLREAWSVVSDGFQFGNRRISITDFLTFAIVFAIGYTATRLLQSTLKTSVLPRTRLDAGGRNAILSGTGYLGLFLAALAAITSAGLDLSSLAIVAGALSVGIGFGLQAIVSNFVSGIILLVERPIKEGDWIEVGAYSGYVRKISVRSTEIETFDRATVVVPNADFISGTVTNWTHSSLNGRVKVPIGVAYDSDPDQVRTILTEIAESHEMVDHRFNVSVVFLGFGADALNFEIRAILKDVNWVLSARSDMNYEILRRFRAEGIEIPFAQRDVNLRNIDDLGAAIGKAVKSKP